MTIKPFTSPAERTVLALLDRDLAALEGDTSRAGGNYPDSSALADEQVYVRIERVAGSSDRLEGDFVLDIETFSASYSAAESAGFAIEALLLGYPHRVRVGEKDVVLDRVEQNQGPQEIPWEDDNVHRLSATYVITARRALS